MKAVTTLTLNLTGALLILIATASIVAAQTGNDTCLGANATIGGTCVPLTNTVSRNNFNTALGWQTLERNSSGTQNTATGANALLGNTSGSNNTATGVDALGVNSTGSRNTATGMAALLDNTTGSGNTATGMIALLNNTTGDFNAATGVNALKANTTGGTNAAMGAFALQNNIDGNDNTATGFGSLNLNTDGGCNTAIGSEAIGSNTTGNSNTAVGVRALESSSTGNFNIAIGQAAGGGLTTGDNNIDIFDPGLPGEANTIRIGTQGTQAATFVAGIFGASAVKPGCPVFVDNTGRLGCTTSSARYKSDIRDMGDASDKLMKLRPVTFRYKADTTGTPEYGLIAEEVQKIYPELVIENRDGKAETVAYQELPAILLNEIQKEHRDGDRKTAEIAQLSAQLAELKASIRQQNAELGATRAAFEERLSWLEQELAVKDSNRNLAAAFNQ